MRTVNGCILLLAAISITFAAVSGAYHLDMQQLLALILRQENVPVQEQIVFWQIRVPRILAALFLGAALAGAGTTYQGMFRNPLVSPDILGVSAGAGLGACAAILWGLSIVYIQLYAFCGGLMVVAGVWLITRRVTRHDPILTLVLVGIALGTLCGAGISLIKTLVPILTPSYRQLPSGCWGAVHRDLTRSLLCCTDHSHRLLAPVFLRWRMNLLTLSDDEARSLGLNVTRLRFGLIFCATLITASTVAIAGIIGWVGLVVPHIARLLTGHNHQQLLPMAMCTGAILLLLTDTLARSIGTTEIPLGILTAFVGAPFFLFLLLRGGRQ
ncbi:FecCD family ABC transporter permease [Escherichia coli]